jgi:hypothetical protein
MRLAISYRIRSSMTVFSSTRRTLLTLIGGLSVFRAARSDAADTFTLVPKLAPGQMQRYRQNLQLVRNGMIGHRSQSTVTLEIRERIAGGWLARWTSSGSQLVEADPRVRPMLEVLQALWDGVAIDLLLDEGGRVAGLADPAAVRALGEMSLDRLAALLSADPARAPVAPVLRAAMQPTFADGGMLSQSLLKEPAILLGAMGHDYRVGAPLEVRTRISSPMGSGEIPILGRYQVRGISARDSQADIGWLMVIDRASAARILGAEMLDVVRRVEAAMPAPAGGQPEPIAGSTVADVAATLDFDDRGDFIIDTATAWPVSVRHLRRISSGGGSRVDTVELTRLSV